MCWNVFDVRLPPWPILFKSLISESAFISLLLTFYLTNSFSPPSPMYFTTPSLADCQHGTGDINIGNLQCSRWYLSNSWPKLLTHQSYLYDLSFSTLMLQCTWWVSDLSQQNNTYSKGYSKINNWTWLALWHIAHSVSGSPNRYHPSPRQINIS